MRPIQVETLHAEDGTTTRRPLLEGEIDDLKLASVVVSPSSTVRPELFRERARALLFLDGTGGISDTRHIHIDGLGFYCPLHDHPFEITAENEGLTYLELLVTLREDERSVLARNAEGFYPRFVSYWDSPTYRESFKSEKTVSRTLLPHDRFPRLCIGSVEVDGPDAVGTHVHPMLEQIFVGLRDNSCIVTADGQETSLGALEALHIPLGSTHGARVEAGQKLHYVWIAVVVGS